MRVLITGNMGYVGPSVVKQLRRSYPESRIEGFDSGLFARCLTSLHDIPEHRLDCQHFGDVRSIDARLLDGCDAVILLAAISNDPMGAQFSRVTEEINQEAAIAIARQAEAAGVRNLVFASSCSVYGVAEGGPRTEDDPVNPMTAYASSKIGTERALATLKGDMTITCLRFATACGMSDRLRLDLVLNDFVACALTTGQISVLSDGSPWRPLIDVQDMARAIEWAAIRSPDNGGRFLTVNAGIDSANYQVRDLAEAVARQVPGCTVSINRDAPADSRSYRVDFSRFAQLAPRHQPQVRLEDSVADLVDGLRGLNFHDADFRQSSLIRLHVLKTLIAEGRLSNDLEWVDGPVPRARRRIEESAL